MQVLEGIAIADVTFAVVFFFQAEDGIRDVAVTGVQTCALPISLGDSLFALRFFPALAAAAKVYLSGWMARELSGGRFAQLLAALTTLVAPIYLTFDSFLSMNSFEPLFWMACAAILLRILNGGDERLWLLFGVVAGLGTLNKHSMLFFGSGVFAGLCLTAARREFAKRWVWLAGALALLIFMPNLNGGDERLRSEEHTSELQSRLHLVCRLLLEKKKKQI